MKRKRASPLTVLGAGLALVAVTYTLPATGVCHNPLYIDVCRDALNPFPPTTVVIGDETCTMDGNSDSDDLVGSTYYMPDGGLYCIGSTTYCGVGYDCPIAGLQKVNYICGPSGWFAIYPVDFPQDCASCPDVGYP